MSGRSIFFRGWLNLTSQYILGHKVAPLSFQEGEQVVRYCRTNGQRILVNCLMGACPGTDRLSNMIPAVDSEHKETNQTKSGKRCRVMQIL